MMPWIRWLTCTIGLKLPTLCCLQTLSCQFANSLSPEAMSNILCLYPGWCCPQMGLFFRKSERKWKRSCLVNVQLRHHGLYNPWNSSGQNTGMGSRSLLQGIFPTQGYEPRSPTLQADSLPTEPQGKSIFQGRKVLNWGHYFTLTLTWAIFAPATLGQGSQSIPGLQKVLD